MVGSEILALFRVCVLNISATSYFAQHYNGVNKTLLPGMPHLVYATIDCRTAQNSVRHNPTIRAYVQEARLLLGTDADVRGGLGWASSGKTCTETDRIGDF